MKKKREKETPAEQYAKKQAKIREKRRKLEEKNQQESTEIDEDIQINTPFPDNLSQNFTEEEQPSNSALALVVPQDIAVQSTINSNVPAISQIYKKAKIERKSNTKKRSDWRKALSQMSPEEQKKQIALEREKKDAEELEKREKRDKAKIARAKENKKKCIKIVGPELRFFRPSNPELLPQSSPLGLNFYPPPPPTPITRTTSPFLGSEQLDFQHPPRDFNHRN